LKLTEGVISKEEARKLVPDFVQWVEGRDFDVLMKKVVPAFEKLNRGANVIAHHDGQYVKCKITSSKMPNWDADGPVVRVGNGEATWRVDGDGYCAGY